MVGLNPKLMIRFSKIFFLFFLIIPFISSAQQEEIEIKVYGFEEGLTHRNVFKVQQDPWGFIWIATINGLNKFDGLEFTHYTSNDVEYNVPIDFISDMVISPDSLIWLVSQNAISLLNPQNNDIKEIEIDSNSNIYKQPHQFSSFCFNKINQFWTISHLNENGQSYLLKSTESGPLTEVFECKGNYVKRPIVQHGGFYFLSFENNSLLKVNEKGEHIKKYAFPSLNLSTQSVAWINQAQFTKDGTLWVLFNNGQIFYLQKEASEFQLHPLAIPSNNGVASSMLVEENGDIWVGGLGNLWYFKASTGQIINFDNRIKDIIKNTCNYRNIFQDNSGVIWISSDYGAIKLTKSDKLFTTYLSDGSEFCSDVVCSMRGITEDDKGNIYFSYYNSIHVLDHQTSSIRPLFPERDFFNFPFGLVYHDNALYTGNGKRIDLNTFQVDTLFNKPLQDLGYSIVGNDGRIWIGFRKWLYQYNPESGQISEYLFPTNIVDTSKLDIHLLYQSNIDDAIWLCSKANGLYKIDRDSGVVAHYGAFDGSDPRFRHNQINGIYESADSTLWIATANGLHKWNPNTRKLKIYDKKLGMPNNFVNGLLSEGDSCIWISTDYGLSRFDVKSEKFNNFYKQDGISADEFNRSSFYRAKDGRMFFGGMNGINAFYPSDKFSLERKYQDNKILFTEFSKLDGEYDSIITKKVGLSKINTIELSHYDKFFSFQFALANYQNPSSNVFSYMLEGYDKDWSKPSPINSAKYNGIPPGHYTFRVQSFFRERALEQRRNVNQSYS